MLAASVLAAPAVAAAQLGYNTRVLAPDEEAVAAQTAVTVETVKAHKRLAREEVAQESLRRRFLVDGIAGHRSLGTRGQSTSEVCVPQVKAP